jgi:hypothetical protein
MLNRPDWNIGYTTKEHLCLDLDNTSFFKVSNLVRMIMQHYHEVGNALILVSSRPFFNGKWIYPPYNVPQFKVQKHNYHVIFNNYIGYENCCKIIETLANLGIINEQYVRIRQMRNDMTIRTSKTECVGHTKHKPYPIEFVVNQWCKKEDFGISDFMLLLKHSD